MIGRRLTASTITASVLLLVGGLFGLPSAAQAITVPPQPVVVVTPTTCPSPAPSRIVFSSVTLTPSVGVPGQTVTAQIQATNCTAQSQTVWVGWAGQFLGAVSGIPAGCPAIGQFSSGLTLAPSTAGTSSFGYLIPVGCTATQLQAIARIGTSEVNNELGQVFGYLPIRSAAPACAVSYQRQARWPGGFVAQVTIRNVSTTPINDWSLAFSYPGDQRIIRAWNATVHQTGHQVTARNVAANAKIAAGADTSFGVRGTWRSADPPPSVFTLNGVACTD